MIKTQWPTIAFDLDGTLIDTASDLLLALNRALDRSSLPQIDSSNAGRTIALGVPELIADALRRARQPVDSDAIDQVYDRYYAAYDDLYLETSRPYDGTAEMLDRLSTENCVLVVCTNKREAIAKTLLKAFNFDRYFTAICGEDTFPFKKPDARHLIETINRGGGHPKSALFVGDSETDLMTSRAAKIPFAAVRHGYPVRMVELDEADLIIEHFDELNHTPRHPFLQIGPDGNDRRL